MGGDPNLYLPLRFQTPDYDEEWNTNGHQMRAVELLTSWVQAQGVPHLSLEVASLSFLGVHQVRGMLGAHSNNPRR